MTTRFLGRVPIRQRKPSGPAAAERENKENRLINEDDNDKAADVVGEDTLLAMLNESKIPDKAACTPKPLMESPHTPAPIKSPNLTADADFSSEAIIASPTVGESKEKRKRVTVNHSVSHSNSRNCSLTPAERLQMSFWGLPETVLARYASKGIKSMFEWQAECLGVGNVLDGDNLVYSAPTSAGKTLVAELLLIKRVLEVRKKGLVILPFVSLAREKMFALQYLLRDLPVRVYGFMGSQAPPGGIKRADIAVCTIEKANSIVNRMLEDGTIGDLGIVVVDELHLLGDPSRGYLLELLLTKIRFMSLKKDIQIQIVGMSATLPNLGQLADWLDASLFKTDFRPVPLTETVKAGRSVYNEKGDFVRDVVPPFPISGDSDNLVYLCLETVLAGHSVLVFCPTKNWCEKLADTVAKEFFNLGKPNPNDSNPERADVRKRLQMQLNGSKLGEVLEQLRRCPAGLDQNLKKVIGFATAYHHAGLTFDERDIIEGAFKNGILRVLIATSTLSSGVNLPARRVIIRCPFTFQNRLMDTLTYKQMVGRAGRKGVDTEGESILICRESERIKVMDELVTADLQPVKSCLLQRSSGDVGQQFSSVSTAMKRAILEVVASGAATSPQIVEKYASCTMLAASMKSEGVTKDDDTIPSCVSYLEKNEFIRLQENEGETRYVATQLGLACLSSSLSPDEGMHVAEELQRARKAFVLENELHIVYQVVPIYAAVSWPNMDWIEYLNIWERLSPDMKRVGEMVGVEERFLIRAMRGTINKQTEKQAQQLAIHQRFYTALALHDLVNEVPLPRVAERYAASKGMLQSLQQAASTFAGMVTAFCHKMGWRNMELLIGQFQDRLQFGVQRELIDLCRLDALNGQRARILYNAKIDSVAVLANSSATDVENILANAMPFESRKAGDGETEREATRRREVRSLWLTGRAGVTVAEAALATVEEARQMLQKDLGIHIDWASSQERESSLVTATSINESKNPKKSGGRGKGRRRNNKTGSGGKSRTSSRIANKKESTSVTAAAAAFKVHQKKRLASSDLDAEGASYAKTPKIQCKRDFCSTPTSTSARSVETSSNNAVLLTPVNANAGTSSPSCKSERPPTATPGGVGNNVSFDVSGQIEEIFEAEADAPAANATATKSAAESEDDDMFGESFANISDIDNMVEAHGKKLHAEVADNFPGKKGGGGRSVDRSCPKTPNLEACSEELVLQLSQDEDNEKDENPDKQADWTITDSFLDRAMDTHMSEEDCAEAENNKPDEKKEEEQRDKHTDLSPMPKPAITPRSERSKRLSRRRRVQTAVAGCKKSPGFLVMSDSDSDCIRESPKAPMCSRIASRSEDHDREAEVASPDAESGGGGGGGSGFSVIDVCADRTVFDSFAADLAAADSFAVAVACDRLGASEGEGPGSGIGARIRRKKSNAPGGLAKSPEPELFSLRDVGMETAVVGVAFSMSPSVALYLPLAKSGKSVDLNDTIAPPSQDEGITLEMKLNVIRSSLERPDVTLVLFDAKEQLKILHLALGLLTSVSARVEDPKVAAWMMQPSDKERNLSNLAMNFDHLGGNEDLRRALLSTLGSSTGVGSVAINGSGANNSARSRAVAEAALVWRVMLRLREELGRVGMWNSFQEFEMPSIVSLVHMELNGVGFSEEESERQKKILMARMDELESEAFRLVGHPFQMTSPDDICQVLYRELKLPLNGDPSRRLPALSSRNPKLKPSTNKEVLIKLKPYHEVPGIVLEWRKLNAAVSKVVFAMQKAATWNPATRGKRIYTRCQTLTSTGRISLHEPNIQNIPRDFEVAVTRELMEKALGLEEARDVMEASNAANFTADSSALLFSYIESERLIPDTKSYTVSMRHAVVPSEGFLILAADYSQLELRILAHLSGDEKLTKILNDGKDVFKAIAAKWKRTEIDQVSDDERQQAKQICYGMIYGIGSKSLGEQLGVVEEEASVFLSSFRETYPGVKRFMDATLTECRSRGFVKTLCGRRRYLPKITAGANMHARAAAERQAINTAVQGSAADLVKGAMNKIESRVAEVFPQCRVPLRPSRGRHQEDSNPSAKGAAAAAATIAKGGGGGGAYFLLQMHDELIYEVGIRDVIRVAKIVRDSMENSTCGVSVATPVNIKVGPSWGQLQTLNLNEL